MKRTPPTRILVVEDDPSMRAYYHRLFERLEEEGYVAEIAPDGEHALQLLAAKPVDVLVLDWMLPGLSGPELLRAVRAHPRTREVGVLMVTGRGALTDELASLEAGSDDFISKPFDERLLLARLRGLRRRRELAFERRGRRVFPGLEYDPHGGRVLVEGRLIRLTPKELDLLGVFVERPDIIHPAAFLWERVWGRASEGWERVLISTLSSLRRKLGARWGARLRALRGRGYLLERF